MAAFGTAFGASNANPNKDLEVPSPPSDGISSLKFSPASNLLVATSWSGQVLCWDVQANGQAIPKAAITVDKPVLCSAWSVDGSTVFAGTWGGGRGVLGKVGQTGGTGQNGTGAGRARRRASSTAAVWVASSWQ